MAKTIGLILTLLLLPSLVYGKSKSNFNFIAYGEYGLAQTAGFNQIPKGGSQESSSYRRPNFNELSIHHELYHTLGLSGEYKTWEIQYNHSAIHLNKNVMLNTALFSHGQPLPSDRLYHFNIALNKHQIQLKKHFSSLPKNNNFHFSLFSAIDWLGYHYHFYPLEATLPEAAPSSRREFINTTCSFGSEFQYQWHPYTSSAVYLSTSLPFFHLQIAEAKFIQRFHFFHPPISKFRPYIGISYLKTDLQDKQGLANHLRFSAKPYFFAGITFLIS